MAQFAFTDAKKQIDEIVKIVETCPEPLREKCFELLFGIVFGRQSHGPSTKAQQLKEPDAAIEETTKHSQVAPDYKVPSNILAFTRKYEVTMEMPFFSPTWIRMRHQHEAPRIGRPTENAPAADSFCP